MHLNCQSRSTFDEISCPRRTLASSAEGGKRTLTHTAEVRPNAAQKLKE